MVLLLLLGRDLAGGFVLGPCSRGRIRLLCLYIGSDMVTRPIDDNTTVGHTGPLLRSC